MIMSIYCRARECNHYDEPQGDRVVIAYVAMATKKEDLDFADEHPLYADDDELRQYIFDVWVAMGKNDSPFVIGGTIEPASSRRFLN
ncbi:MAG: hypothetical protein ACRCWB_03910 [Enterovibrio sp.]